LQSQLVLYELGISPVIDRDHVGTRVIQMKREFGGHEVSSYLSPSAVGAEDHLASWAVNFNARHALAASLSHVHPHDLTLKAREMVQIVLPEIANLVSNHIAYSMGIDVGEIGKVRSSLKSYWNTSTDLSPRTMI
jgi:hypothetical protein